MDIISHGLWGSALLGTNKKSNFWLAFVFGILPDLLAFGLPFILMFISPLSGGASTISSGKPEFINNTPSYVYSLYNVGHSLIVVAIIFGIIWFIRRKPFLPMIAWPLHIILDIFTHGKEFFPTPFLWPISDYKFDGVSWISPYIIIPDLISLIVVYIIIFIYKKRKNI